MGFMRGKILGASRNRDEKVDWEAQALVQNPSDAEKLQLRPQPTLSSRISEPIQ